MITRYYRPLLYVVGLIVVACSGITAAFIWAAPPPDGLKNIDPVALKTTAVVILVFLGGIPPLIAVFSPPLKGLLLKAAVFAAAGFSNAMALSPLLAVPFEGTTAAIATVCSLGLAVISILAFLDSTQDKKPQSKF